MLNHVYIMFILFVANTNFDEHSLYTNNQHVITNYIYRIIKKLTPRVIITLFEPVDYIYPTLMTISVPPILLRKATCLSIRTTTKTGFPLGGKCFESRLFAYFDWFL